MNRPLAVDLVFAEFGGRHERASLDLLDAVIGRAWPSAVRRTVIVDNVRPPTYDVRINDATVRIGGDNSLREFSAWERGIAWLDLAEDGGHRSESIVILANDTVVRADKSGRIAAAPATALRAAADGALVGWIDEFPRPIGLFGCTLRQFVDTSFLVAARRTLERVRPLVPANSLADVFSPDWRRVFREGAPLSANYRSYLRTYFFGEPGEPDFTHAWYAQTPLGEDTFEAFKQKACCVFAEHLLSARASGARIPLVDMRPIPLRAEAV
jgi:hypothetical protein